MIDLNKHMAWVVFDSRGNVPCMAADEETAVKEYITSKVEDDRGYFFATDIDGKQAPFDQPHTRSVWDDSEEALLNNPSISEDEALGQSQ